MSISMISHLYMSPEEVDDASDPSTEPGSEASEAETEDEEVLFREDSQRI